jgi:hypothetical protein
VATPQPIAAKPIVAPEPPPRAAPKKPAPARVAAAKLSVSSDPGAQVFVDGEFAGKAPLTGYELPAGRHVVRVEGYAQGLRLVPKEETVILREGEARALAMELK